MSRAASSPSAIAARTIQPPAAEPSNVDRVQRALALIERAQSVIRSACCELSSVPHFGDEYAAVCELETTVRVAWDNLESSLLRKRSKIQ